MEIRITKDGEWKDYPYRTRVYLDSKKVWEDDFGKDAGIGDIWRTLEDALEEQGIKQ